MNKEQKDKIKWLVERIDADNLYQAISDIQQALRAIVSAMPVDAEGGVFGTRKADDLSDIPF